MRHRKRAGILLMLKECFVMSMNNILANKMRSFLTVLGIMIGVTAVIALITTVSGFSGSLSSSFSSMGAGSMTVNVTGSDLKTGMTCEELDELAEMEEIDGITPTVSLRARVSRGGNYQASVSVSGKNAYFFRRNSNAIARGRTINRIDEENSSYVCAISDEMVSEFFYGDDPIGQTLYISGIPFLVVGLLNEDDSESIVTMMSGSYDILIPYTTALRMNSSNTVTSFTVYLADGVESEEASTALTEKMDVMFSFEEDCFTVTTMSSIEDTMKSMLNMVSTLLTGIASIALIVGGIGIMNMMLTTVTERITEIGLKKAMGAFAWQIQAQFLSESLMLSLIGGFSGVFCGLLLSLALCNGMGIAFSLSGGAIILGISFSMAVGILFGWMPARRASRLNPIDALRVV